ncbi:uncharacterized protein LOC132279652 [Cornus florida]|uniref:uncharacterized protein LOC132279652 n=1 Tax=Cornus florida TaxID=4283 RepID=UPI00289F236C|nr:uncharacterized protein LOC132279652 [Cornus florida]
MALRATRCWRSMVNGLRGNRSYATAAETFHANDKPRSSLRGEFAPIYMMFGMIMVALTIGAHTAKQQLVHSPAVKVNKKRRESMQEVDNPDAVVGSADKFVNKSFLRKVARIQDHQVLRDSMRPDPFTRSRDVETLKSAGVRTSRN